MSTRARSVLIAVILVSVLADSVRSETSARQINFQGCPVDPAREGVEDNVYAVRLRIYADSIGGEPLWETTGPVNVETVSGCFRHMLGSTNPLPDSMFSRDRLWVGIAFGSNPEGRPRTLIITPAEGADRSEAVGGLHVRESEPATSRTRVSEVRTRPRLPLIYAHGAASLGFSSASRGRLYRELLDPFKPGLGVGYTVGVAIGIRNIYQFEFRPRSVGSVNLRASDFNITIPMDFHLRNVMIHRLNLLAFKTVRGRSAPCLFMCYGTAEGGSVRHVDEYGDGFQNGKATLLALEFGMIADGGHAVLVIERHAVTFKNFAIAGIGSLQEDIDASYWLVGFRLGLGVTVVR